jgi:hypothetical protein
VREAYEAAGSQDEPCVGMIGIFGEQGMSVDSPAITDIDLDNGQAVLLSVMSAAC